MSSLPVPLRTRLAGGRHDFHRRDADREGVPPATVASWVQRGLLEPLGGGDYVIQAPLPDAEPKAQARRLHLRRCHSILAGADDLYLVGRSSAWAHGLPLLEQPDRVEVSRRPRPSGRRASIEARMPWGNPPELVQGLRVQKAAEAAVEIAALDGPRAALVPADAALREGVASKVRLDAAVRDYGARRGVGAARIVAALADGRVESPGESLVRWEAHLADVDLTPQVVVHDEAGRFVARVDFLVRGTSMIVEFDGMGKYRSPDDLAREKRRQIALERLGFRVLRFTWADVMRPGFVGRTLREASRQAA